MDRYTRVLARQLAPLLVLGVFALPTVGAAQETQDTTRLPAALRTARAAQTVAFRTLDAQAAGGFFADSAVVNFQGQVFTGQPAVGNWLVEALQGLSAVRFGQPSFLITETVVTEKTGYTVVLPDGTENSGNSESVWRRQSDGKWKVVRLTVM